MRAPPQSLRPMTGAPTFIAMSMTLQIFCAWRSLKRAAEHGEILREDIDQPAVDRARSGDHAVAGDVLRLHPEVGAIMLDEHVIFFEAAGIEQDAKAARARSAGPWRAAPRCASRRRPAAPPRAAFRALRSWLPFGGSSPSKSGDPHVLPRSGSPVNRADWRMLQCSNGQFRVNFGQCCGTAMPPGPFIHGQHITRRLKGKC